MYATIETTHVTTYTRLWPYAKEYVCAQNTHTNLLHDVEGRGLGQSDHLHQGPRHVLAGVAVVVEQQDLELVGAQGQSHRIKRNRILSQQEKREYKNTGVGWRGGPRMSRYLEDTTPYALFAIIFSTTFIRNSGWLLSMSNYLMTESRKAGPT